MARKKKHTCAIMAARFESRPSAEFEFAAKELLKQSHYCKLCDYPEDWYTPLNNAALLLLEVAAYKES